MSSLLLSEFVGSLIFLLGGYAYMCNVNLKKTLVGTLNYIELVFAWSLAVGFGLAVAVAMGGPAYLNPGVVIGNMLLGNLSIVNGCLYILTEFVAAGAAIGLCLTFFKDSFNATPGTDKRGIFSAYPVEMNLPLNFVQEMMATFFFLFIVFMGISKTADPIMIGLVGFGAVALLSLTLNSTGFSMNAMRSFFSSMWFAVLPVPNKGAKVDWVYQVIVNLIGSSLGGVLAVYAITLLK